MNVVMVVWVLFSGGYKVVEYPMPNPKVCLAAVNSARYEVPEGIDKTGVIMYCTYVKNS